MNTSRQILAAEISTKIGFASERLASLKRHREILKDLERMRSDARKALDGSDQEKREASADILLATELASSSLEAARSLYEQAGRMLDGALKLANERPSPPLSNGVEIVGLLEAQAKAQVANKLIEAGATLVVQIEEYTYRIRHQRKWVW